MFHHKHTWLQVEICLKGFESSVLMSVSVEFILWVSEGSNMNTIRTMTILLVTTSQYPFLHLVFHTQPISSKSIFKRNFMVPGDPKPYFLKGCLHLMWHHLDLYFAP